MPEAALLLSESAEVGRAPGVQVTANGQILDGIITAGVRSNNYFGADCFEFTVALDAETNPAVWWQAEQINVDLQFRMNATSEYHSLINGSVDRLTYDPIGRLVRFEGRDFSSRLIDSPMGQALINQTASEIATLLAVRHGLLPSVTRTTTIIGRYYQNEPNAVALERFSDKMTEWDFLSHLAQQENFDLYVYGTTLNFRPVDDASRPSFIFRPADLIGLRCERMPMMAGNVSVTVRSWSTMNHAALAETVGSPQAGDTSNAEPTPQRYVILRPNLTSDSARQLATRKLRELNRHVRTIQFVMPADLALTPRCTIQLCGTYSDFDQIYRVDTIERRFSPSSGFVQLVRAGNIAS